MTKSDWDCAEARRPIDASPVDGLKLLLDAESESMIASCLDFLGRRRAVQHERSGVVFHDAALSSTLPSEARRSLSFAKLFLRYGRSTIGKRGFVSRAIVNDEEPGFTATGSDINNRRT
jgi:hypothetical protein